MKKKQIETTESIEEFLNRGGNIKKLPDSKESTLIDKKIKREYYASLPKEVKKLLKSIKII